MIKKILCVSAGLFMVSGVSVASQDFSDLSGVDAVAMSKSEMAQVEGKAHGGFPLGALLIERANAKLLSTPAWTDKGLHPFNGPALGNARVPTSGE